MGKKNAKKKRDVFINGYTTWSVIQLSRKLSWHVQAPDNKVIGSGLGKFENKPKTTWSRFPVSVINFFVYKTDKIDICTFPYYKYSSFMSGCVWLC